MNTDKVQPKITDPEFVWTPPVNTNVQDTWKRHGWVPPSEQKKQEKEAA